MTNFSSYIKHPSQIFIGIIKRCWFLFNEKLYLELLYFFSLNKKLNLSSPQTFTEKIQWLKLYNRKKIYTTMVDKISAKEYVARLIGNEIIIPTLGIWNKFEEIEFNKLPDKFVLKTNHSGGSTGIVICKDKSKLDIKKTKKRINSSLRSNCYYTTKEWPYKNVKPKIFAEQFIEDPNESDLIDYKFYCFNGETKYCQVITGRNDKESIDFYDTEWNHQTFHGLNPKYISRTIQKPMNYEQMIKIANKLSKDIPFIRIDLYNINGKIYFGEMTFFPASGIGVFTPDGTDKMLGDLITL